METILKRILAVLFLVILVFALPGCRTVNVNTVIGILSSVNAEALPAGILTLGLEQNNGYELAAAGDGSSLPFTYKPESAQPDEVQVAIREMAEKDKVLAVLGGTSNEATMRAASLVNFFNLPMIVPTAGGDNLLPSNNLWAFRLSAPGSGYAVFMIDSLLAQQAKRPEEEFRSFTPNYNIAIFYEENTFGESAAVAAAQAAMRQEMKIVAYQSFAANNPDPNRLRTIFEMAKTENAQVISLISSSPDIAIQLVSAFDRVYTSSKKPALVGLAGGFASHEFMNSPQAEGVFTVRQQLNLEGCPIGIDSIYAAQTYGARYILNEAARLVQENMPEVKRLPVLARPDTDPIIDLRERLRDELKLTNMDVPCIGRVAFDNAGQIKDPKFELVFVKDGVECDCSEEEFQAILLER
jgi:hypothetical protein